jgi:hypothetical protein
VPGKTLLDDLAILTLIKRQKIIAACSVLSRFEVGNAVSLRDDNIRSPPDYQRIERVASVANSADHICLGDFPVPFLSEVFNSGMWIGTATWPVDAGYLKITHAALSP